MKSGKIIAGIGILIFLGLIVGSFFLNPDRSALTEMVSVDFESSIGHNEESSLGGFLENVMGWLRKIIATVAILFLAIAGVMYIMGGAGGNENLMKSAKTAFFVSILGLIIALAGPAMLKQVKDIALKDNNLPTNLEEAKTLSELALDTLNFILTIIGILAVIAFAVSGIMYLAAGAKISQAEAAKKSMVAAIVGFAMAGSALIIVEQIKTFFIE